MNPLRKLSDSTIQCSIAKQLLVLAGLIALVLLIGAILAGLTLDLDPEDGPGSWWWTFVRITDPGYLVDDQGR